MARHQGIRTVVTRIAPALCLSAMGVAVQAQTVLTKHFVKDQATLIRVQDGGGGICAATCSIQLERPGGQLVPNPALTATSTGNGNFTFTIPRTLANDLPDGDYVLWVGGVRQSALKLTRRAVMIRPQLGTWAVNNPTPMMVVTDHMMNPDGSAATNDQLFHYVQNTLSTGESAAPGNRHNATSARTNLI